MVPVLMTFFIGHPEDSYWGLYRETGCPKIKSGSVGRIWLQILKKKIITLKQLQLKRPPLQVAAQTCMLISLPPQNPIKGQREGTEL